MSSLGGQYKMNLYILFVIYYFFNGVALALPILSDQQEWEKFKVVQQKQYKSTEEEAYRFKIFQENLQKIREHNEKYEKGETSYKQGINKFSDLSPEEFKAIFGRGVLPPMEKKHYFV